MDIEELKRKAEAHLANFHADSMPPMKLEAQTVLALIARIRQLETLIDTMTMLSVRR
jgi:hypothetical protein